MKRRKLTEEELAAESGKYVSPLDRLYEMYGDQMSQPVPPREYIYITRAPFDCKIGRTTRPDARPLQVAGNAPVMLEVLVVKQVEASRELEKRIHDHYQGKWLRGEWFALDDSDIAFIRDVLDGKAEIPEPEIEDFEDILF